MTIDLDAIDLEQLKITARLLADAGFGPIPIRTNEKAPEPGGFQGQKNPMPTYEQWERFMESSRGPTYMNLGVRMPPHVVAIDLDLYKKEDPTLELASLGFADWPQTVHITARGLDRFSGHYLFRLPDGVDEAELTGKVVGLGETLRFTNRYSMAPGSWNRDAEATYQWLDRRTGEPGIAPADELPLIPNLLLTLITKGSAPNHQTRTGISDTPLTSEGDGACGAVLDIRIPDWAEGSRHDTMNNLVWRLVRLHYEGHRGVKEAVTALRASYVEEMDTNRRSGGDSPEEEFDRSVRQANDKQAGYTNECFCDLSPLDLERSLWDRSPQLKHVHDVAVGRKAAPVGTLLVVLTRLVATTAPNIVLPPLIGGNASLNMFTMLVGDSGGGKGACERAAKDVFYYTDWAQEEAPGSGEGLAHTFAHREKGVIVRHATNIVLNVAEVDSWKALSERNGSTLDAELRKGAMGETLGFAYADPQKRIPIAEHSYRLCMLVGIQPDRGEWMIQAAAGGTPQRFVWGPTWNDEAVRKPPPPPAPLTWTPPTEYPDADVFGWVILPVCQAAIDIVDEFRYLALRREAADPLDGHRTLVRLKVAVALGLLHGRAGVNDEDWETSGILMRISTASRRAVENALTKADDARGVGYALREVKKAEVISTKQEAQCLHSMLHTLEVHAAKGRHEGGCTKKCLRIGVRSTVRTHVAHMLEQGISAGQIKVDEAGKYSRGQTP